MASQVLTQTEISTINEVLKRFLESAEGFAGFTYEDKLETAWDDACDFAANPLILGQPLFELFLTISEENLREACWETFTNTFLEITGK